MDRPEQKQLPCPALASTQTDCGHLILLVMSPDHIVYYLLDTRRIEAIAEDRFLHGVMGFSILRGPIAVLGVFKRLVESILPLVYIQAGYLCSVAGSWDGTRVISRYFP